MCTIKKGVRATFNVIPFKRNTRIMTRSLIYGVVDLLKRITSKDGVSDTLSLSKIVEGRPKVDM